MTRVFNTHRDFKSARNYLNNAENIYERVGDALENQHTFEKRILPSSYKNNNNNNLLTESEIDNFVIDVEKIDRLYNAYNYTNDVSITTYVLICRVEYEKKKINNNSDEKEEEGQHYHCHFQQQQTGQLSSSVSVYIKMFAHTTDGVFAPGRGKIYIGTNVDIFMNIVSIYTHPWSFFDPMYDIRQLLAKDGIISNKHFKDEFNTTSLGLKQIWYIKLLSLYSVEEKLKSFDSKIIFGHHIYNYIGYPLKHQHSFEKITDITTIDTTTTMIKPSSSETRQFWNEIKIEENFEIDVRKIDIIYRIDHNVYMGNWYFELVCRMRYLESSSSFVFVRLVASCCVCNKDFVCRGKGKILISQDISSLLTWLKTRVKKSPPTLQYLCHLTITDDRNCWPIRKYYFKKKSDIVFPKKLKDSMRDFVTFRKKNIHNKYW